MTLIDRVKAALAAHPEDRDLQFLVKGWQGAISKFNEKPNRANKKAAQELETDLEERLAALGESAARQWPDILDNVNQVALYLRDIGFEVPSRQTIYNHVKRYALIKRQDGRFDRSAVDAFTRKANLKRAFTGTPQQAARPAMKSVAVDADNLPSLLDIKRDIACEDLQAKQLANKEKLGALADILIVDREQQDLCQAVRMHLSPMIRTTAEQVLSLLGGDPDVARQMIDLSGGDPAKADDLAAWVMARKPELVSFFKPYLRRALDSFATGEWYTQEMREAWATYQRQREDAELDDIKALIRLAGGDDARAGDVLEQYYVRRLD